MEIKFTKNYQVKTTTSRDKKGRDIVNGLIYREGETYDVPPETARHFIVRQVAEAVDPDEGAAALAAGPGGFAASLPEEKRDKVFAQSVAEQKRSREDADKPIKAAGGPHPGEPHAHPGASEKAAMEAEGRAPKNPVQSPARSHHKS